MEKILAEICAERAEQDRLWDGPTRDDKHTPSEWVALLARHIGLAVDDGEPNASGRFRKQMVRTAALAVAAVESFDRNRARGTPVEKVAGTSSRSPAGT